MVARELNTPIDYILYEMEWHQFIEAYNWCLMYVHDHQRVWENMAIDENDISNSVVYDEANQNWIEFMPDDKDKYEWQEKRKCWVLPKVK